MSLEKRIHDLERRAETRFYGKYRGVVVDNADPEQRGRIKVNIPSVLGSDIVSGWAMPCLPYGGAADQGFFYIPEIGAGVWMEFEEGDLEFPIWVGTYWQKPGGDSEVPKPNKPDGTEDSAVQDPPTRKIIKTLKGHTIQLEDKEDEEMILVVEGEKGHFILMDKDGIKIVDASHNKIVMNGSGITITDKNNNIITMDDKGIKSVDTNNNSMTMDDKGIKSVDVNNNEMTMDNSGVSCKDANGNEIKMSSSDMIMKGIKIKIGSGASEKMVKGTTLDSILTQWSTMLSTHTHVGNMGAPTSPPVPPLVLPPTVTALSNFHMVE